MVCIDVQSLHNFRRILRGADCLKDISHYNYFTPTTLADLYRRAGFHLAAVAPTIGSAGIKRTLKSVLDRPGIGDCSVLLQKQEHGTT